MSEDNGSAEQTTTEAPSLNVLVQYVKDLSFENPGAPQSLRARNTAPNISIGVNVQAAPPVNNEAEVSLSLDVRASEGDQVSTDTTGEVRHLKMGGMGPGRGLASCRVFPFTSPPTPLLRRQVGRTLGLGGRRRGEPDSLSRNSPGRWMHRFRFLWMGGMGRQWTSRPGNLLNESRAVSGNCFCMRPPSM